MEEVTTQPEAALAVRLEVLDLLHKRQVLGRTLGSVEAIPPVVQLGGLDHHLEGEMATLQAPLAQAKALATPQVAHLVAARQAVEVSAAVLLGVHSVRGIRRAVPLATAPVEVALETLLVVEAALEILLEEAALETLLVEVALETLPVGVALELVPVEEPSGPVVVVALELPRRMGE